MSSGSTNASFKKAVSTSPPEPTPSIQYSTIVNYVWINAREDAQMEKRLCTVPPHSLAQALQNARKYPDASVNIWVDEDFLNASSRFFLQSYLYCHAPENVTLKSLHEIRLYQREFLIFDPISKYDIESRVDLARLIVMDHCFKKTNAIDVIYSDFDVDDICLESRKMKKVLEQWGAVFGSTYKNAIENGFMAFRRGDGEIYLREKLLPATLNAAMDGEDGFRSLLETLWAWTTDRGISLDKDERALSVPVLHSRGYKMPIDAYHLDLDIY